MSKDAKPRDLMGYRTLQQEALRGVVRAALKRAASEQGLPGEHHFYISFKTDAPGVSAPPDLLAKYPGEMTIVLQHQFQNLAPGETYFSVSLRFGGQPKNLSVPYAAVTRFYDPSVQYLLEFAAADDVDAGQPVIAASNSSAPEPKGDGDEPKVVSLDQFRKK